MAPSKLVEVAKRTLNKSSDGNKYNKKEALNILIKLGYPDIKDEIDKLLDSPDEDVALEIASELANYVLQNNAPNT